MKHFARMEITLFLLASTLLILFWGVLAQFNAGDTAGGARFFNAYFVWIFDIIPVPALKSIAAISCIHLVCSMIYRVPRYLKNIGIYLIHLAVFILIFGSLIGAEFKTEYYGFQKDGEEISFYDMHDTLGYNAITLNENLWTKINFKGDIEIQAHQKVPLYTAIYDPFRWVPYVSSFILLLGIIVQFFKNTLFKGAKKKATLVAFFLIFPLQNIHAETLFIPEEITPFTPVIYEGEVRSFDAFARNFYHSLSSKKNQNATEIIARFIENPDSARLLPIYKINQENVMRLLHLEPSKRYFTYEELENSKGLLTLYAAKKEDNSIMQELKHLNSTMQISEYLMLLKNGARNDFFEFYEFSDRKNNLICDEKKIKREVFYHRLNLSKITFFTLLFSLLLACFNLKKKSQNLDKASNIFGMVSAFLLLITFIFRYTITSKIPLATLHEIVLLIVLLFQIFLAGSFLFCKKRHFDLMFPITLMSGLLLLLYILILEPADTFQKIPEVLNSSVFLTLHVLTIALGFFGVILSGLIAHIILFRLKKETPTALIELHQKVLLFGSLFSILGTLLGGFWADYAWGRFWGFDPKECGALFVVLWSMFLIHLNKTHFVSQKTYALLCALNIIIVLLCWFGINLLGIGLHSYGFQMNTAMGLGIFILADLTILYTIWNLKSKTSAD